MFCWNFLCVDLHSQCDNAINQCYFIFALWSIMGLDTYCCLIFYGLTLIHLTGLLSQVVQIMCVMCDIYKCKEKLLLLGLKKGHALHTHLESTHGLNLGCRKGRTHWTQIFIPSRTEHILGHQWSTKMAFYDINQGKHFIYFHLMHALMSTYDPMLFKNSSIGIRA